MKLLTKLAATFALSAFASAASATWIPDTAGVTTAVTFSTPYSFTHDITDQPFVINFDTIVEANWTFFLTDPNKKNEIVTIQIGAQSFTPPTGNNHVSNGNGNGEVSNYTVTLDPATLEDLADGFIKVILSVNDGGDYTFLSSSLNFNVLAGVEAEEPLAPAQVPEPFSLGLMALGLAAAGVARRRKN